MTNRALKRMINEEIEQLKPDRSVLNKAKLIMAETHDNSVEIQGDIVCIKKKKFNLFHLMALLIACVVVVTMSVCLPIVFMYNDVGAGGGISSGELTNVTIQSLSQDAYAVENGLLHFDYNNAGLICTEAAKYSNLETYISITENVFYESQDKYLSVYVNGNDLRGDYDYDILMKSQVCKGITVTYGAYDVEINSMLNQSNKFLKLLRGKFEYNMAHYYFEIYSNQDIQISAVIDELLK